MAYWVKSSYFGLDLGEYSVTLLFGNKLTLVLLITAPGSWPRGKKPIFERTSGP